MKLLLLTTALLLSLSVQAQDKSDQAKGATDLDKVILMQDSKSTLTLQDLANAMNIKSSDFKTDYTLPTQEEYQDLDIHARPIIVWENPQEITNPNPPANRPLKRN